MSMDVTATMKANEFNVKKDGNMTSTTFTIRVKAD